MLGSHNFWGRALQLMLLGQEWCMYRDTLGSTIFFYLLVFLSSLPCEEKKVLRWLGNVLFGYLTPLQDVLVRHKQKTPMPCNQTVIKQEQPSLDDVHASHLVGFPQCFFCPRWGSVFSVHLSGLMSRVCNSIFLWWLVRAMIYWNELWVNIKIK